MRPSSGSLTSEANMFVWCPLICLLLCPPLLAGQQVPLSPSAQEGVVMQYAPQIPWIGFQAYLVTICNKTAGAKNFSSSWVRNDAMSRGISPASYSTIQRSLTTKNRTSVTQILLSATELVGWTLGLLTASEAIWKPSRPWQKGLPIVVGGAIRVGTTLTKRHTPPEESLPSDLLPTFISLPAGPGTCAEYTLLAIGGVG